MFNFILIFATATATVLAAPSPILSDSRFCPVINKNNVQLTAITPNSNHPSDNLSQGQCHYEEDDCTYVLATGHFFDGPSGCPTSVGSASAPDGSPS
ncbi:hypothetical protein C8R47DRAFT_1169589 [Mycena vitilis]|nr:hypothetical protein C8R47DRAFT_1169589 [Mycena vitilis]